MKSKEQLAKDKGQYQAMIWTYKSRRKKTKENCHKILSRINIKLRSWNREIKRIDKRSVELNKISEIEKSVNDFLGVNISGKNGRGQPKEIHIAKGIFYKYCLKNNHKACDAIQYIKGTYSDQADDYRRSFTEKYKNDPELRNTWLNFKAFHQQKLNGNRNVSGEK